MKHNDISARVADPAPFAGEETTGQHAFSAEELSGIIAEAIRKALPSIKVYVLESDITASQNAVRAIVEQSKF